MQFFQLFPSNLRNPRCHTEKAKERAKPNVNILASSTLFWQILFTIGCWNGSMTCYNSPTSLANYELWFGMACGKNNNILRELNFCLLPVLTNCYLHYNKVNVRNLDWVEFTLKVNYKLKLQNQFSGILLQGITALIKDT